MKMSNRREFDLFINETELTTDRGKVGLPVFASESDINVVVVHWTKT